MSLAELRFSLSQSPLLVALKILVFRWALGGPGDYYTDMRQKSTYSLIKLVMIGPR